jgi:hypothetical protein
MAAFHKARQELRSVAGSCPAAALSLTRQWPIRERPLFGASYSQRLRPLSRPSRQSKRRILNACFGVHRGNDASRARLRRTPRGRALVQSSTCSESLAHRRSRSRDNGLCSQYSYVCPAAAVHPPRRSCGTSRECAFRLFDVMDVLILLADHRAITRCSGPTC